MAALLALVGRRDLGHIESLPMTESKAETLYEEVLGVKALDRQRRLAELFFPCCGERRLDGHHELCASYVEPKPVAHPSLF